MRQGSDRDSINARLSCVQACTSYELRFCFEQEAA